MLKRIAALVLIPVLLLVPAFAALAADKATPQEVYDKVIQAAALLEQLGPDGLAAFNDPKGEFVWKDSYVFVLNCKDGKIAAHPMNKLVGMPADTVKDMKTGAPIMAEACKDLNPKGGWKEYYWTMPGKEGLFRKISVLVPVPGQPYQVGAGIYNDTATVAELNKPLGR